MKREDSGSPHLEVVHDVIHNCTYIHAHLRVAASWRTE